MYNHQNDARKVANTLLHIAAVEKQGLDLIKLQCLLYLAHGWGLVLLDRDIINESPEAWKWIPIYSTVYYEFQEFGKISITRPYVIVDDLGIMDVPKISNESDYAFLKKVWSKYRHHSTTELYDMIKTYLSPCEFIRASGKRTISLDVIKTHFDRYKTPVLQ